MQPPTAAIREYVDTLLVAAARVRDAAALKALVEGQHAAHVCRQRDYGRIRQWTDDNGGLHLTRRLRRRPGVRVGRRVFRSPYHVHQPDEVAMEEIRSAVEHGRAAVLRLDVATDISCATPDAADALHADLRRSLSLSGGPGGVRVSHASAVSLGTTYMGVAKGEEGAPIVIYSDTHAAEKNGGLPTCHVELRLFGSRVVRAAVGRALEIERAWRRVRVVDDLARVPRVIHRAAQNAGPFPYAQDVADVLKRHGLDRRAVFSRATPFQDWLACRNFALVPMSTSTPTEGAVVHGLRVPQDTGIPQRAMTRTPNPHAPPTPA